MREVLDIFTNGREHVVVLFLALVEQVVDCHQYLARLGDLVASLLGVLVPLLEQDALLLFDLLHLLLLGGHRVLDHGLLHQSHVLFLGELSRYFFVLVGVLLLLHLELLVLGLELLVAGQDVDDVLELVGVRLFDSLQELLVFLHLVLLGFDPLSLSLIGILRLLEPLDVGNALLDLLHLRIGNFYILAFSQILLLQKCREFDEVLLDEYILLSELCLLQLESLLFHEELFLLVIERFLHFVHETTFLKKSRGGRDRVQLQVLWQFYFFSVSHLSNSSFVYINKLYYFA